jgi:hypothetical protein
MDYHTLFFVASLLLLAAVAGLKRSARPRAKDAASASASASAPTAAPPAAVARVG